MAQIVAGFGVPHTPVFPFLVKRDGPGCETAKLFAAQAERLAAVGVDATFTGPNDEPRDVPIYSVASIPDLACHIRRTAIEAGFDVALTQHFSVDHSVIVPLHFLTPTMQVPIIPIFISGHVPPLPSARRCHAFGQAVAGAIAAWPSSLRVAVMGSGSFSLEVGGPRMAPGRDHGVPDPDWVARVVSCLEQQQLETLIAQSTQDRLFRAGNVGGELLNWIAMLGAIGDRKPEYVAPQIQNGHAYGVWRW
jgi:gallate dioxygenase